MAAYRASWASKRVFSLSYFDSIRRVVADPLAFYLALALKIIPNLHTRPMRLRLTDDKVLEIGDFWSLFIFDEIFIQRDYEPPLVAQRRDVKTIIDVGANVGLFTLRAKQIWPDARVLAFEPDRDMHDVGELIGVLERHGFAVHDDSHLVIATR